MLYFGLLSFVPYPQQCSDYLQWLIYCSGAFAIFSCSPGKDAILLSVCYLSTQLLITPKLYDNKELDFTSVCYTMSISILMFVALSALAMLLTYISKIRYKLNRLMVDNLKLLDQMHEGLIVLTQRDRVLQFASKPAINLLK